MVSWHVAHVFSLLLLLLLLFLMLLPCCQDRAEKCGCSGKANNLAPRFFWPRTGLANFLGARDQIADNYVRNSFVCGNLSLLEPYFGLFHWSLSASYSLAPRASARVACPLVRPLMWLYCCCCCWWWLWRWWQNLKLYILTLEIKYWNQQS